MMKYDPITCMYYPPITPFMLKTSLEQRRKVDQLMAMYEYSRTTFNDLRKRYEEHERRERKRAKNRKKRERMKRLRVKKEKNKAL